MDPEERLYATVGECLCEFGVCTRNDVEKGENDYYEPDEPDLELAELPWFYFISSPMNITERNGLRDRYLLESEPLWGKEHWMRNDVN